MKQMARELTNHEDGFLQGKRYLIMDRDTKFSDSFRTFLSKEGVESVRLPPRQPVWSKNSAEPKSREFLTVVA